ncbi:hypothetical protein ACFL6M_00595 [Candidatus Eisenbacteria bacterium]|uniref:Peptidase C-terminal archaeal/bacterial domain-containing protein n=1 Tax=Eiseniibacteriota bacterium TaxID=2212470 RepID=A0ABV6YIB5_UNCEI
MRFVTGLLVVLLVSLAVTSASADKIKEWVPPIQGSNGLLDCSNAIPINCGDVVQGNNTGLIGTVTTYSCVGWSEDAGEVVYEIVVPVGECKIITGEITDLTADLDVFFLGSCEETDCLAYGNSIFTSPTMEAGTYYIVVDGYYGAESAFTLTVTCMDMPCPTPPCCPSPFACTVFDFNESDQGFQTFACGGNPVWAWGAPTNCPMIACDDVAVTHVLATNPVGDYGDLAGEIAAIGPVAITEECFCLELCHWYDTENYYDGCNVKVSADGGATWTLIHPNTPYIEDAMYSGNPCIPGEMGFTGHDHASDLTFMQDCFSLSEFVGQEIMIGFFFGSDSSVGYYPGWYIKWVKIGGEEPVPVQESTWGTIKSMFR